MLLLPVVLQYLLLFRSSLCDKNVEVEKIKDYLLQQSSAQCVTAFLDWNLDDLKSLGTVLNEINIKLNVKTSNSLTSKFSKINNNIYIVDLSNNGSLELLNLVNKNQLFRSPNHWFIIYPNNSEFPDLPTKEHIFTNFSILADSQVIVAEKTGNSSYVLNYVYKIGLKTELIWQDIGKWNYQKGFEFYNHEVISRRRHDLQGYTLRISLVIQDNNSYEHMTDYRFNYIDAPTKLNYLLTSNLLDYLNASRKLIHVPTWYNPTSRDQNNTLIGTVLMRQVDITGSPFFCKPERLSWFDCIAMTTPARGFFLFRRPPLSYVRNIYALPFGADLWLADVAFLLLAAALLYLTVHWEWWRLRETHATPDFDMIDDTWSDAVLFTMGAVCQQGYATEPKGAPGKVLMITVFVTLIFLFTAYTAYTVVLFQATADNIKTLEDLHKSKMAIGLEDKPYFRQLFPTYTDPAHRHIYQKIAPPGQPAHIYPLAQGMARVRSEFFAFFTDQIAGYRVIHDTFLEVEKCGLQEIKYLHETDPWIVSPKHSSYLELFKIGYRKLQDSGLYKREIRRRIAHKPECSSMGNSFRSAGVLDLYSVYMLLIIGVASSFVILLFEIIIHKYGTQIYTNITNLRSRY